MARIQYAGRLGDTVASLFSLGRRQVLTLPVDANGDPTTVTLTVWDAPDGTQLTDLQDLTGNPITQLAVPATGQIPAFFGPDGVVDELYLRDPEGDYHRIDGRSTPNAVALTAAASALAAQEAAEAARDMARDISDIDVSDDVIDAALQLPGGKAAERLSATFAPRPGLVVDVVNFGAQVDGVTDDTAAWQAAIDFIGAAGGGKITSSRMGVSIIAGPHVGSANAQLVLPSVDYVDGKQLSIVIAGATPAPTTFSVIGDTPLPDNHLILESTQTEGIGGQLLGAHGPEGTTLEFSNIKVGLYNLTVRMPSNPYHTGVDLRNVAAASVDNLVVDSGSYYVQGLPQPVGDVSYGLRLPKNDNGADTHVGRADVIGFYHGYEIGEHTEAESLNAWGCWITGMVSGANHASKIKRFMSVHCRRGLQFNGPHALDIDQFNIEHATSGWWTAETDIHDPNNFGRGAVRWHVVKAGVGVDDTFVVTGGLGLDVKRIGQSTDTRLRDITSLIPPATLSGNPLLRLYVRRVGPTVTYTFIRPGAPATAGTLVLLEAASIPAGFGSPDLVEGGVGLAVGTVHDNDTGLLISNAGSYFSTGSGLKVFGATGAPFLGSLRFDTSAPSPLVAPGVPV